MTFEMREGTQEVELCDNLGLGPVGQFFVLMKGMAAAFKEFEEMIDKNKKEECVDGPNRHLSERYGLKVMLCRYHHQGDIHGAADAIHNNPDKTNDLRLKCAGQRAWEERNTKAAGTEEAHEAFRRIFGKNYL